MAIEVTEPLMEYSGSRRNNDIQGGMFKKTNIIKSVQGLKK
jgi:hypothetical protein